MKRIRFYIFLSLSVMLMWSCIQTSDPEIPNRMYLLLNVDKVGSTVTAGEESIVVNNIKLLTDKFNLLVPDGAKLESQPDGLIMEYRTEKNGEDELVLSVNIGYEDFKQFNGMELFVAPPAEDDNIQDNDFFGSEKNYSLVIKGEHNGNSFVYNSNVSFEETFEFPVVDLTGDDPHIVIRLLLDIEDILIDPSTDQILDPENEDNKAVIDSLTQSSINLEAFATDQVLFEEDF